MASSAIPFLFPSTALWVDGHPEHFGDGSMRQVLPLSPAMHLGAHKILVVGVGQPTHASRNCWRSFAKRPRFARHNRATFTTGASSLETYPSR
jgi:predicted acylesterase/phospholipase RssA